MAKAKQNWGAFVLQLIGSLVFLATVFGGGISLTGAAFAGVGAFWLPVFIGIAVIASVALFFASFGYVSGMSGPRMGMIGLGTDGIAGLTLVALSWGSMNWVWTVILGFVLCFLGSAMAEK